VVIVGKLLCLFTAAEGECLVRVDAVERFRHITGEPVYLSAAAAGFRWVYGSG
jgi:hypothetical protein